MSESRTNWNHQLVEEKAMLTDHVDVEEWLAARKREGLKIDPETAEVTWWYAQVVDPYGVERNLPEECQCIGRAYFARRPESDIWVCFDDLPDETADRLFEKFGTKLAFPAGFEDSSPPFGEADRRRSDPANW
jgi:hypothetical protein